MSLPSPRFRILARAGAARRGVLETAHGQVQTPAFMPVGTHGSVKACHPDEVARAGADMLLANFYHLALRPGVDLIEQLGGLHKFMGWSGSILTDSGGYQMVSLDHLVEFDDDGVTLRSPYDGSQVRLTPEQVVSGEVRLGVDVAMVLDHPVAFGSSRELAQAATRRTHLWAERSRQVDAGSSLVFGIVQGGFEVDQRRESALRIGELGFDGVAIGGLVLGEPAPVRFAAIEACIDCLPVEVPRYLMGLGSDLELLTAISQGVDMFDCVLPTRLARTGTALTRSGRLALRRGQYRTDPRPLEPGCECPACGRFSRAYLRHLHLAGEILAHHLMSLHNLHHLGTLMADARAAIVAGELTSMIGDRVRALTAGSLDPAAAASFPSPGRPVP
ncbi:MAG: tRNA guanosine(34) transglycosylase Tgt [Candidatus Dormibacteria bacterium]